MKSIRFSAICGLVVVAAFASTLGAQKSDAPEKLVLTPAQRTFAQAYVAAITGADIERYVRLLHPRTRACITPANAEFFDAIFKRRVGRYAKNPQFSVRKVKNTGMITSAKSNGLSYPERPSHMIQIDIISSGPNQYAIVAYVVRENGIWYEVLPCPSQKSFDLMRETRLRAAQDSAAAKALADSLQEPLRAEVLTLLRDSGSVTAAKRYAEVTQIDLAMARRVVKALLEPDIH